jgi:hypothetical protein
VVRDRVRAGRETDRRIGAGRRDIVGGAVVLHRDRGVFKNGELVRDLARSRRGEAEHGDERTYAEDGAEHGQPGPARPLHDPRDRLGGRVPDG